MKLIKTWQWKATLREAAWLIGLSLALACAAFFLRPGAMPGRMPDEGGGSGEGLTKTIAFEAAVDHFQSGTAIFADARPLEVFEAGHIKGALHLDPSEFDQWSDQVFAYASTESTLITYGEDPQGLLSRKLAEKLTWMGFENVCYLNDGWRLWKEHKLPISKGNR
ncbi:MAG: rhodanese-like domain-containing protein [Desulfobacteraceae bacterium]|jgi:rhodanese-related sulfurtransferase